jgi:hypothetical protein
MPRTCTRRRARPSSARLARTRCSDETHRYPASVGDGSFALAIAGAPGLSQEEIMALASEETLARFAPPSMSTAQSTSLEGGRVVKASPGRLYSLTVRIDSTLASGSYYVQIIDAASTPANGAVTFLEAPIKVQHVLGFDDTVTATDSSGGLYGTAGLYVCISSTEFTKTLVTSAASISARYV